MNPSWPLNIDVPCAQPLLLVVGANRPDAGRGRRGFGRKSPAEPQSKAGAGASQQWRVSVQDVDTPRRAKLYGCTIRQVTAISILRRKNVQRSIDRYCEEPCLLAKGLAAKTATANTASYSSCACYPPGPLGERNCCHVCSTEITTTISAPPGMCIRRLFILLEPYTPGTRARSLATWPY